MKEEEPYNGGSGSMFVSIFFCISVFISSCTSQTKSYSDAHCGYVISTLELDDIRVRTQQDTNTYDVDSLWNLYDQINDSVRAAVDDSIVFEVFMTLLTETEIGIDIYSPGNDEFVQKLSCIIMNGHYKGKMPAQRYAMFYAYTNPDGSGDLPFVIAIKRQ